MAALYFFKYVNILCGGGLGIFSRCNLLQPLMPKNAEKFICEKCDFKCSKLSNYNIHIKSKKHNTTITTTITTTIQQYECICGKQYNHRASLFNHKKKCNYKQEQTPKVDTQKEDSKDNMIDLLLENQKDMLMEKKEMKDMFIMFLKNQMESQSTQMENQNNIDSIKKVKQK